MHNKPSLPITGSTPTPTQCNSNYSEDGVYIFDLSVNNQTGKAASNPLIFEPGPPQVPEDIPPFTCQSEVSAIVSGVPEVVVVPIEVKPEGEPDSINCNAKNTIVPITIFTTDVFDATTVDHTTVAFEGASETHVDNKTGEPRRHEEDVDGDGDTDLVFHFRLGDTTLTCASTDVTLTGQTFDGQIIVGTDTVRMIDRGGGQP